MAAAAAAAAAAPAAASDATFPVSGMRMSRGRPHSVRGPAGARSLPMMSNNRVMTQCRWRRRDVVRMTSPKRVICWSGYGKPEVETQEPSAAAPPSDEEGKSEDGTEKEEAPPENEPSVVDKVKDLMEGLANGQKEPVDEVVAVVDDLDKRLEESLVAQLTIKAEKDQISDKYMRLNADFDNFRKRMERERITQAESAKSNVIEELLPVIDAFELARNNLKIETDAEAKINSSYQGIYKQLVEVLQKIGLTVVETVGQPFDPEVMDAIMREPTTEAEEGTVLSEYRKGFKIGDQLLRPAMVQVAVAVEESDKSPDGSPQANMEAAEGPRQ